MIASLPDDARALGRIPRAGAFVVQAPRPLLSRLAARSDVRSVIPQDGRSAFIPPVHTVVETDHEDA